MFWEKSSETHNAYVANAMRNRFNEILQYLHLLNNDNLITITTSKLAKVLPYLTHLNEQFLAHFPLVQDLFIDESIIPYFGRHSAKQFI